MTKKNNIFIGVAWPYVNGDLHIGHLAGYLLPADITARFFRATGHQVLMVSGSDCHGTPITVEADQKGLTPKQVADFHHQKNVALFNDILDLSFDLYTRTDTDHHAQIVQDFFLEFYKKGYLFVETTNQYYSPAQNRFLPDRYVIGTCKNCGFSEARSDQCDRCGKLLGHEDLTDPRSKLTNSPVEFKQTKHYFIDWAKLEKKILKYVSQKGPNWKTWVFQESLGWLKQGLIPRAVTRDIDWGVAIPSDQLPADLQIDDVANKRLYVWFDAVIGYYSASLLWAKQNHQDWRDFWYNPDSRHYYFMGKDNLIFHTLFWPAQLMVKDEKLHLPDLPSINMFLDFAGEKFSKSKGTSLGIAQMVDHFGDSALRFNMIHNMPETKDSSFSWSDFLEKNNGVLVANLGNYLHRVLSISKDTDLSQVTALPISPQTSKMISQSFQQSRQFFQNCQFRQALDVVTSLSDFGNRLLSQEKLWLLKNDQPEKYLTSLKDHYAIILALGHLFYPLLPKASDQLAKQLSLNHFSSWPQPKKEVDHLQKLFSQLRHPPQPSPLFSKITPEDIDQFLSKEK